MTSYEKKSVVLKLWLRLTPSQHDEILTRAAGDDRSISNWIRHLVADQLRKKTNDGLPKMKHRT